jgi:hypothetical protein
MNNTPEEGMTLSILKPRPFNVNTDFPAYYYPGMASQ